MPIKIVSVYAASDGQTFETEREAKAHEIEIMPIVENKGMCPDLALWIVDSADKIIAILTSKPDAPPKRRPRSDKGRSHARRNSVPVKEAAA